jgi:hypothetical protein
MLAIVGAANERKGFSPPVQQIRQLTIRHPAMQAGFVPTNREDDLY